MASLPRFFYSRAFRSLGATIAAIAVPAAIYACGNVDLSITKTSNIPAGQTVTSGQNIQYTITIKNNSGTAANPVFGDSIPAGTTFVSATGTSFTCKTATAAEASHTGVSTPAIYCKYGTYLRSGQSATVKMTVKVNANAACGLVIKNTAKVRIRPGPGEADVNMNNNTSNTVNVQTQACPNTDVTIAKSGQTTVGQGQNISYTLTATNVGQASAENVIVTDPIPSGLLFVPASSDPSCTRSGNSVSCAIGTLAVNQSRTLSLVFSTAGGQSGFATFCTQNLMQNGSFEDPAAITKHSGLWQLLQLDSDTEHGIVAKMPGWNNKPAGTGYQIEQQANGLFNAVAQHGTKWVEVDAEGFVLFAQTVTTIPGEQYRLRFYYSPRPDQLQYQQMAIFLNGQRFFTVGGTPTGTGNNWSERSFMFTATTTSTTIGLGSDIGNGAGNLVDNMSLNQFSTSCPGGDPTTVPPLQCPATVQNQATISTSTPESNSGNNVSQTVSTQVTCPVLPDLSISKSGASSVVRGNTLTYSITVTNNGQGTAQNVVVTDAIPSVSGISYNDGASDASCNQQGSNVVCSIGTLTGGQSKTITIAFDLATLAQCSTATAQNTASVSTTSQESNTSNNVSQTVSTQVTCPFGCIDIFKETFNPQGQPISTVAQFTFTLEDGRTAQNFSNGQARFDNVTAGSHTVTEQPNAGWTLIGVTPAGGVVNVPAGGQCVGVVFKNQQVLPLSADVSVVKSGPSTVVRGNIAYYTISAFNSGPGTASNVSINDVVPTGLTFNQGQSTAGCALNAAQTTVTCGGFNLNNGESRTFTIAFNVPAVPSGCFSSTIINKATVSTTTNDPDQSDNTSQAVYTTLQCPQIVSCSPNDPRVQQLEQQFGLNSATFQSVSLPNGSKLIGWNTSISGSRKTEYINATSSTNFTHLSLDTTSIVPNATLRDFMLNMSNSHVGAILREKNSKAVLNAYKAAGYTVSNDAYDLTGQILNYVENNPDGASKRGVNDTSCNGGTCRAVIVCDSPTPPPVPDCRDGIDNDSDGLIDFPEDPGCTTPDDDDEFNQPLGADLSIIKSGPSSVTRGNVISYTVTAFNGGPATATNVVISDVIPAGLTFNQGASSPSCVLNGAQTSVLCNNFSLTSGQSKTVTIAFNVPTVANCSQSTIQNVATVSSSSTDPDSSDNTSQTVYTTANCPTPTPHCRDGLDNDGDGLIDFPNDPGCSHPDDNDEFNQPLGADLSIVKSGPSTVVRGNTISYVVTAFNGGPAAATNVVIADVIPSGLTFNQAQSSAGCVLNGAQTSVLCNNFNLASGQSKTFVIAFNFQQTAQTCSQSTIQNVATVSASSTDPDSSDNVSQTVHTTVTCPTPIPQCRDGLDNDGDGLIDFPSDPGCSHSDDDDEFNQPLGADLSIIKSGPSTVVRGNVIAYTVTAFNGGPATATNVVISDVIPATLTFLAGQSSAGCVLNGAGTSVLCNNFNLASGQSKTFVIAFTVQTIPQCSTGTIQNTATVSASSTDPDSSDNVSQTVNTTATCPIVPQCRDGIDNDGDGKVDFPQDPGCTNPDDDDESNQPTTPQCSDGIDNDGDGKIDYFDPGCYPNNVFDSVSYNPNDNDESNSAPPLNYCRWHYENERWVRRCGN